MYGDLFYFNMLHSIEISYLDLSWHEKENKSMDKLTNMKSLDPNKNYTEITKKVLSVIIDIGQNNLNTVTYMQLLCSNWDRNISTCVI